MNQTIVESTSSVSKLPKALSADKSETAFFNLFTIALFFAFVAGDILFSINKNLVADAAIIPGIFIIQLLSVQLGRNNKNSWLSTQNTFFITTASLFAMSVISGYSAGSYFYFFPAAIFYIANTANTSGTKRFRNYLTISLLFTIAILINYVFLPQQNNLPVGNNLMLYRFFVAVVLSAVLSKDLLIAKAPDLDISARSAYNEALFQNSLDGYIIFNQETLEVIDHNKRMLSLFELPADADLKLLYITQVMMRYLAEDSANKLLMMDRIPDYWHGEAGFVTHKKNKFYSYVKSVVYCNDETNYQILSIRDITPIKKTDAELKLFKENVEKAGRAKARFLSSMSHELRTPLNGIIGTSNLMKSETELPDSIQKHIDVLLYSSEHMLGIINNILDFSKIDAGKQELKKQSFNLKKCLDNLTGSFITQFKNKNIQLIIDQSPEFDDVNILSDETKLTQVINNLLSNALKFTLEGSVTLTVKIKNQVDNLITIDFDVSDTGIGIPKDKQVEIFQGFAQVHAAELSRRFGGTGLGLTISEKLVAIFGGKLAVESELEKGSRFYFTLDFETAVNTSSAFNLPIAEDNADIRGIKVLVVEDNEINAKILKSFLKKWEVQVKEAGNGVHALEILKYHQFDLILLDLEMPEMDGYTAIKIIRQTDKTTPILAFTASLLENMDSILAEAGFNGYVLKPYRPAELKAKIELYAPHRKIAYA
jgi:signal transduction histidine kinase/CheY-like chemotaxis protein